MDIIYLHFNTTSGPSASSITTSPSEMATKRPGQANSFVNDFISDPSLPLYHKSIATHRIGLDGIMQLRDRDNYIDIRNVIQFIAIKTTVARKIHIST